MRIIMTPFAAFAITQKCWQQALFLSICAFFTDLIDGPCARWWNQVSSFGAALDSIADKLFMVSMFTALLISSSTASTSVIFSVLAKECALVFGACYLHFYLNKAPLKPTTLGKVAIALQLIFLGITCIVHAHQYALSSITQVCIDRLVICATFIVVADYSLIYTRMNPLCIKKESN
jgi:phosphatidylglycerophosphate synthase